MALAAAGQLSEARLTFERLLQSLPKRTDLWAIYLDVEQRYDTPENVRSVRLDSARTHSPSGYIRCSADTMGPMGMRVNATAHVGVRDRAQCKVVVR